MNHLRYWVIHALRGVRAGLAIHLVSTGAIALSFLLLGLAVLCAINVDRLTRHWGRGIHIMVYPKADVSPARIQALANMLRGRAEVLSVRQISSAEAYNHLLGSLGGRKGLLSGIESDFLPSSLEISLNQNTPDQVQPLLALLNSSPLIEEVDDMGTWVERLNSLVTSLRAIGLAIALIVGFACLYIIGSTIRLGVFTRREEVEIQKLVGATDRFVKAPFMIEGAFQGFAGSLLAAGLLYLLFRGAAPHIEDVMASALSHVRLGFLSLEYLGLGVAGGTLLGVLGSRIALGRHMNV